MPHPVHVFCAVERKLTDYRPPVLPSLGDALAVHATSGSRTPELVSAALAAAPWCAVLLLAEQPLSPAEAGALLPLLPDSTLFLQGGLDLDPTRIIAALRLRAAPAASDLCAYLRLRRLPGELITAVEDALAGRESEIESEQAASDPNRSTINRRLAEYGPLRARSWRALLRVLQFTTHVTAPAQQGAVDEEFDSRTFRARSQDLVGLAPRPALGTPGWEWKLEAALRRHRYVTWPGATRRSSAALAAPVLVET